LSIPRSEVGLILSPPIDAVLHVIDHHHQTAAILRAHRLTQSDKVTQLVCTVPDGETVTVGRPQRHSY